MDIRKTAVEFVAHFIEKHGFKGKDPKNPALYKQGSDELIVGTEQLLNALIEKNADNVRLGAEKATLGVEDIVASYIEKA